MKYKLNSQQKQLMDGIFNNMKLLSEDKEFMKMIDAANNGKEDKFDNEDDYLDVTNLVENVMDTAKCNFNYYNIK